MKDLKVTVESTQIMRHNPAVIEGIDMGKGDLNLPMLAAELVRWVI